MSEQIRQATLEELRTVYAYARQLEERLAQLETWTGNKESGVNTPVDQRIYDLAKRCAQLEAKTIPQGQEAKVNDLEVKLARLEHRIPSTGLLSHRLLVRVITVMCYIFFAQWVWSLLVSVLPLSLTIISGNVGLVIIPIAILIVLVILRSMFPAPPTEEYITRRYLK